MGSRDRFGGTSGSGNDAEGDGRQGTTEQGDARHRESTEFPGPPTPWLARMLFVGVLISYSSMCMLNLTEVVGLGKLFWAGVLIVVLCALQCAHSSSTIRGRLGRYAYLTLAAQGVLTFLPLTVFGFYWVTMAGLFVGSVLVVLPPRLTWALFGLLGVVLLAVTVHHGYGWVECVYWPLGLEGCGFIVFGLSHLSKRTRDLRDARTELAQAAVTRERLAFARDVNDLLGSSLSSITLKSELVRRLIPTRPDRAVDEVAGVLTVSRQALSNVRAVTRGYRDMSLEREFTSAREVLVSADVDVRTRVAVGTLDRRAETALAAVLREAVTNVLRHSRATTCDITAARTEHGVVRLSVTNDGTASAPLTPSEGDGTGLGSLAARLRALGGGLTVGRTAGGGFRLVAELPAEHAEAPSAHRRRPKDRASLFPTPASRTALGISVAVLLDYVVTIAMNILRRDMSTTATLASLTGLAVSAAIQCVHFCPRTRRRLGRRAYVTLGVQGVLAYLPIVVLGQWWGSMAGFFCGSLLLLLPSRPAWVLYWVAGLSLPVSACFGRQAGSWCYYYGQSTLLCGIVVYAIAHFYDVIWQLHRTRDELARAAVAQERLRFARDLHDLLGYSLSSITLKSELVRRLIPVRPEQAMAEADEVLAVARQSLADVRTVVSGYRDLCLEDEIASARSVLSSAGIALYVECAPGSVGPEADTVLATVLREAVTNLLRHSKARHCTLSVTRTRDGRVRLTVRNDGAAPAHRDTSPDGGSGLGNLIARLEAIGGRLRYELGENGTFRLTAEAPAQCPTLPARPVTPVNERALAVR
ncbi:sensor histidine kinase [Streptomyces sp. NPDC021100]|uniref:sensor histidine kinase n=1 Tax=Streptomyces sp. NPDC021100 TaxID=3365114 RepID=UPI0037B1CD3F